MPNLLKRLLLRLGKPFGASAKLVIYQHDLQGVALDLPRPFRRNHWPDLEGHRQSERWLDTPTFLRNARDRLDAGEQVYTYAENGELLAWFWVVPRQERAYFPAVDQEYRFPPDTHVFYEVYVCPKARGRGLYTAGMRQLLAELQEAGEARHACCAVHADNAVPHKVMSSLGFHAETRLNFRRRLWRQAKWADQVNASPAAPDSPSCAPAPLAARSGRQALLRAWHSLRHGLYDEASLLLYRHDLQAIPPAEVECFARNRIEDVLSFRPVEGGRDARYFQHQAWARLADGEWLYSHCTAGILDAWFWVVPGPTRHCFDRVRQDYCFPPGSYVSHGAHTRPTSREGELFCAGESQLLRELAAQPDARHAYCALPADKRARRAAAERLGYRLEATLRYRRVLFWQRRWQETAGAGQ